MNHRLILFLTGTASLVASTVFIREICNRHGIWAWAVVIVCILYSIVGATIMISCAQNRLQFADVILVVIAGGMMGLAVTPTVTMRVRHTDPPDKNTLMMSNNVTILYPAIGIEVGICLATCICRKKEEKGTGTNGTEL